MKTWVKGNSDSRNVVGLLVRDEGISGSDPPGYVTAPPPHRNLCSVTLVQLQRKQAIHCSRARSYEMSLTKGHKN